MDLSEKWDDPSSKHHLDLFMFIWKWMNMVDIVFFNALFLGKHHDQPDQPRDFGADFNVAWMDMWPNCGGEIRVANCDDLTEQKYLGSG